MLRRLAAIAAAFVVLAANAGFGTSPVLAGSNHPKPACCRPSEPCASSQFAKPSCCQDNSEQPTQAPASNLAKAPEASVALTVAVAEAPVVNASFLRKNPCHPSAFSTAPPIFSLKSSRLI